METYITAKELVPNPKFPEQRQRALNGLNLDLIDKPIVDLIARIMNIPYCFTLQCCCGHFPFENQPDARNTTPLPPPEEGAKVDYCIAYVAFCVENNGHGGQLLADLNGLRSIDPQYVQFGSAGWFWDQQVNSYIVQVEPDRFKTQDRCIVEYQEATHLEQTRDWFFEELGEMLGQRV